MSIDPTYTIADRIKLDIDNWKVRGLTPSIIRIGPDIQEQLIQHYGTLPVELFGLNVVKCESNGFWCIGPWHYVPVNNRV